ncbi:MAG: ArsI/CadI family heavy metal resistance metalloenzyme [Gammaproteobacteria bacterium]|jgi:catechol 2,3-dioxygenase-like lactoylglutathione lyase family enzyme
MKRFHVHVSVDDLDANIAFYSRLFGGEPSVVKDDYAKWMLDDPRINFAISRRGKAGGIDHLGLQVDAAEELDELGARIAAAGAPVASQEQASCCYSRSNKHWTLDPQGIAWESFHSLGSVPVYGEDTAENLPTAGAACCVPEMHEPGCGCG